MRIASGQGYEAQSLKLSQGTEGKVGSSQVKGGRRTQGHDEQNPLMKRKSIIILYYSIDNKRPGFDMSRQNWIQNLTPLLHILWANHLTFLCPNSPICKMNINIITAS